MLILLKLILRYTIKIHDVDTWRDVDVAHIKYRKTLLSLRKYQESYPVKAHYLNYV